MPPNERNERLARALFAEVQVRKTSSGSILPVANLLSTHGNKVEFLVWFCTIYGRVLVAWVFMTCGVCSGPILLNHMSTEKITLKMKKALEILPFRVCDDYKNITLDQWTVSSPKPNSRLLWIIRDDQIRYPWISVELLFLTQIIIQFTSFNRLNSFKNLIRFTGVTSTFHYLCMSERTHAPSRPC